MGVWTKGGYTTRFIGDLKGDAKRNGEKRAQGERGKVIGSFAGRYRATNI
jgi:hypothetical protein